MPGVDDFDPEVDTGVKDGVDMSPGKAKDILHSFFLERPNDQISPSPDLFFSHFVRLSPYKK
jgi:hypothetical protein